MVLENLLRLDWEQLVEKWVSMYPDSLESGSFITDLPTNDMFLVAEQHKIGPFGHGSLMLRLGSKKSL